MEDLELARRILAEKQKKLKAEAKAKLVANILKQETAYRRKLKLKNAVEKLARRNSKGNGLTLSEEGEDYKGW